MGIFDDFSVHFRLIIPSISHLSQRPERGQDFGTRARQLTSDLVFSKLVEVKEYYPDRYGRMVARIFVDGRDVSLELVKAGLAWHFKRYSKDPLLAEAEVEARDANRGIVVTA